MATIKPFRAVRYAPGIAPEKVVTQPYDKIPPALWKTYKERDPHNLVNLILPSEEEAAAHGCDKYTWAARQFRSWLDEGVLVRDPAPGFFPYRQSFDIFGWHHVRPGFIGLLQTEEYGAKIVFPHERTLTKPKADRLSLLRATRTHFGQIFLLYEDDGTAQAVIDASMAKPPVVSFKDDFAVTNDLWRLDDGKAVASLQRALANKQVFIADGHHRYETSLKYAQSLPNDPHAQFTLAMFINVHAPLVVLPTHRTVAGVAGYDRKVIRTVLGRSFELTPCASLMETLEAVQSPAGPVCIGCYDGSAWFTAQLKDGEAMRRAMPNKSDAWRALDVAVLHTLVIEQALGLTHAQVEQEAGIGYWRDPNEACEAVMSGAAQCAFFLRGTQPAQVCAVARNGEVMPQKSTDFYPKLLSGLAMYPLDLQQP